MLKGKTALVTGSTSGIGLGIATRLAAEGANIVLNGFGDASLIEKLKAELKGKSGTSVTYDPADMTRPAEIAAMLARAKPHRSSRIFVNWAFCVGSEVFLIKLLNVSTCACVAGSLTRKPVGLACSFCASSSDASARSASLLNSSIAL